MVLITIIEVDTSEFGMMTFTHSLQRRGLTWVVLQYSPTMTLAKGSDSPEASEPIKDLAWYM